MTIQNDSPVLKPQVLSLTPRWLVVSKPAGMLSIPGRGGHPILSDWARQEYGEIWIVHRLDLETSGVILFARTELDHQEACSWFRDRKAKKVYSCLASGVPNAPIFKVNQPLSGAASITQVEVRESYQEGFLARVFPRTGRKHQIRIHLANSGYPIWGDDLYGGPSEVLLGQPVTIPRVALHASSLEIPTGEKFEADFPEDFKSWLSILRKEGRRV